MLIGQNVRNKLINADFSIWQRNTSFDLLTSGYTADRWMWSTSSGGGTLATGSITKQDNQIGSVFYNRQRHFLRITNTSLGSGLGANSAAVLSQRADTAVNSLAGSPITVSIWAASTIPSKIMNVLVYFLDSAGTRYTGAQITLSGGAQVTRYDVSLVCPTRLGTPSLLSVGLAPQQGGTSAAFYGLPAVDWQGAGNIDIHGVQINAGGPADFETAGGGDLGVELAICQRYFFKTYAQEHPVGYAVSSGYNITMWDIAVNAGSSKRNTVSVSFPVTMRAIPAVSIYNPRTGNTSSIYNVSTGTDVTFTAPLAAFATTSGVWGLDFQNASSTITLGNQCEMHLTASAEL